MISTTRAERSAQGRHAARGRAAKNGGVTLDEYDQRRAAGEKFCTPHRTWHPVAEFGSNARRADGLESGCRDAATDANRRHYDYAGRQRPSGKPTVAPSKRPVPMVYPSVDEVDPRWRNDAACRGEDPELFHPVGTSGAALAQTFAAKRVCASCPVKAPCLADGLARGDDFAVLGGLTRDERRAMRRGRSA